jgi:hypothetical protein
MPGHDLRTVRLGGADELAEPLLGVLNHISGLHRQDGPGGILEPNLPLARHGDQHLVSGGDQVGGLRDLVAAQEPGSCPRVTWKVALSPLALTALTDTR